MPLINCPDCSQQVSDQASTCLHCGRPISVTQKPTFQGPPVDCLHCGGALRNGAEGKAQGSGCIIIILGLLLAPFLIGIPIVIYGMNLMNKTDYFYECQRCGSRFPRHRGFMGVDWSKRNYRPLLWVFLIYLAVSTLLGLISAIRGSR